MAEAEVPSHILHNPLFLMLQQIEFTCSHTGGSLPQEEAGLNQGAVCFSETNCTYLNVLIDQFGTSGLPVQRLS